MSMDVPKFVSRRLAFGLAGDITLELSEYHDQYKAVWNAQDRAQERCGVRILDPMPYLCSTGLCYGTRHGRPLYYDSSHLSEYGNRLLIPMFSEVVSNRGQD